MYSYGINDKDHTSYKPVPKMEMIRVTSARLGKEPVLVDEIKL
jgi:hypothetical protein